MRKKMRLQREVRARANPGWKQIMAGSSSDGGFAAHAENPGRSAGYWVGNRFSFRLAKKNTVNQTMAIGGCGSKVFCGFDNSQTSSWRKVADVMKNRKSRPLSGEMAVAKTLPGSNST